MTDRELTQRITNYLTGGGLFNPEMANHEAVRDLLIDCRDALAKPEQESYCKDCGKELRGQGHIHTCSPQVKRWVGLTNDEVNNFAAGCHLGKSVQGAIYQAEAALRGKNT